MLGNFSAAETLMTGDESAPLRPRRNCPPLTVRVTFEESRLAARCLATAYDQIMPLRRRSNAAGRLVPTQDQPGPRSGERTGT